MTNIFGILKDKKRTTQSEFDGACFICKRIESDGLENINDLNKAAEAQNKKMNLPLPLAIIKGIAFFVGMVLIIGILRADVSLSEAFNNAPEIFYILPVAWLIFAALQFTAYLKKKNHMASDEFQQFLSETEETAVQSMQQLGIPSNAPMVDTFTFPYKIKKEKLVPSSGNSQYVTVEFFIYQDADHLYLADHTTVFGFNKKDFVKIEKVSKKATSYGWNKDEPINSEKFKKYKLGQNQYGVVFYKYYYSIQLSKDGKIYELLIPPYEVTTFAAILNLPFEE